MDNTRSAAQIKADKKYREKIKNDEELRLRKNYLNLKSNAKNFVLNKASVEDLLMLQEIVNDRLKEMRG